MFQPGFFDVENRLEALSEFGDPLEKLTEVVDFDQFRKIINRSISFIVSRKGGRPPWDSVLMFKILILQTLYNISDEQLEFQIKDRLSFQRFLGLSLGDKVPDAKTIWLWRERFKKHKLMDKIFRKFDQELKNRGYLAMSGQIIDASIVQAPRQQNTKKEKDSIKEGKIPEDWKAKPHKLSQKDLDAHWNMKYKKAKMKAGEDAIDIAIPQFGYKNHVSTDKRHGLIRRWEVTAANMYDGHMFEELLDPDNTASPVYADTAYGSKKNRDLLETKGLRSEMCLKKPRGKAMSKNVKKGNKKRASIELIAKVGDGLYQAAATSSMSMNSHPSVNGKPKLSHVAE
jgi:transposase, IS5 family